MGDPRYPTAEASTRIFKLENRCTGNRTVVFESHPLRNLLFLLFYINALGPIWATRLGSVANSSFVPAT